MAAAGGGAAVMPPLVVATVLVPLNATMIAVALPDVTAGLDAQLRASAWLVTSYLIAVAAFQPVMGKLGDRHGHRRMLRLGVWWFALASVGAAASVSLPMLMAFRVQQALAGAVIVPSAAALIRERVPGDRRGRALGALGSAAGLAAALGPVIGGALTAAATWRGIFAVNLPLAALALVLSRRLAADRARPLAARRRAARFDLAGALLLTALLTGVAALLSAGDRLPPGALAAAAPVLGAAGAWFVRRELRHPEPVLQPRFFRNRAFAAVNAAAALSNLALFAVLLAVPLMLSARDGWGSGTIGLALAALSLAAVVASPVGGRLADRSGRRLVSAAGLLALAAGIAALAVAGSDVGTAALLAALAAAGAGMGLAHPGLRAIALESLAQRHTDVAAGILSTSRYLGSIASAGLLVAVLGSGSGSGRHGAFFAVAAAAAALAFASVLAAPVGSRRRVAEPMTPEMSR
jgi:DHA2 family methylenomycin A resistance protein-like MFS transporter